ncbi:hypothetical protein DY000_02002501 [Brassica cretica]|uniref:IBB domain-containing protein n=1 Tax=Brassica cretica TaxID=69181 RepID=A0ABQ7BVJ2_BRACR|nr:hypothetical protein DY000_02002501 [Brassica cretica]
MRRNLGKTPHLSLDLDLETRDKRDEIRHNNATRPPPPLACLLTVRRERVGPERERERERAIARRERAIARRESRL